MLIQQDKRLPNKNLSQEPKQKKTEDFCFTIKTGLDQVVCYEITPYFYLLSLGKRQLKLRWHQTKVQNHHKRKQYHYTRN